MDLLKSGEKRHISLEMRLLTLCSSFHPEEEEQKKIRRLVHRPIDWEVFHQLALKNRVYPPVYRNLKKSGSPWINEAVMNSLETQCKGNQLYSLLLASELFRVTEGLNKIGISVIAFKGPLLSLAIYQDISMRVSRDLDLLAAPEDIPVIDEFLRESGFERTFGMGPLSFRKNRLLQKTFHHETYQSSNGIQLELHWRLLEDSGHIAGKSLGKDKQEISLFGKRIYGLKNEENFIYLIIHGSKHAWKRLRWLCDIYELMKARTLDWNSVVNKAEELGVAYLLEQTLLLLHRLYHYPREAELELKPRDKRIAGYLARKALLFLCSSDDTPEIYGHALYYEYKKYMLVWNRGSLRKLSYIAGHFVPKREDLQKKEFRDRFFFLYYLWRLLQILSRPFQRKEIV